MSRKSLILPSTRAFFREGRTVKGQTLFNQLHGYAYARWPYFYIGMGTGAHPLAKALAPVIAWVGNLLVAAAGKTGAENTLRFEDTYHGKVVPLEAAKELVSIQQDINLGDLEHVIPYALAREIVLKNPDHIVVLDCPCRAAREHPCLPVDVCLIVGEPFASFVADHHPGRSRWITSAEAQAILKAEDERGHVHHAFFKDAMLGRFYAICNCCSCCCGAMQAQRQGTKMLAASGFRAQVDTDRCQGCGSCEQICQFEAIAVSGRAEVNPEKCMGCGICANNCPNDAVALVRVEGEEPLEINALMENFHQSLLNVS